MKKLIRSNTFEQVCRIYVFGFLNIYGWGKMLGGQFYRRGQLPEEVASTTLADASAFDLAWTFMGYSQFYILFVGVLQIIGAWMLLWNRTKIWGTLILLPIMTNIVAFDIVFLNTKGALVNATIYLIMLLFILYHNRNQVRSALRITSDYKGFIVNFKSGWWLQVLVILVLMVLIFIVDHTLVSWVGH